MASFIQKLETYPVGICGASLAFITLSNCWSINGISFLKPLALIVAIIAVLVKILRMISHHETIWSELKDPILGSLYPTIDMVVFLIAASLLKSTPTFAKILWLSCIIFHGIIFILFIYLRSKDFNFKDMVPSWFVVFIGVAVGTVSSTGMGFPNIAKALFYFGFFWYTVMWPLMLYRIIRYPLNDNQLTSIGIMGAPASLCLVAYLTAFQSYNSVIIIFLTLTSIFNICIVYSKLPNLLKKEFIPGHAALTFPLAISILAMYKMYNYARTTGFVFSEIFKIIGDIQIIVGTYVILYVLYNFGKRFFFRLREI